MQGSGHEWFVLCVRENDHGYPRSELRKALDQVGRRDRFGSDFAKHQLNITAKGDLETGIRVMGHLNACTDRGRGKQATQCRQKKRLPVDNQQVRPPAATRLTPPPATPPPPTP